MIGHLGVESHITGGRPKFRVTAADGAHRASLQADGTVVSAAGQARQPQLVPARPRQQWQHRRPHQRLPTWQVLAYIEADGTVGGPDMSFLGEVSGPRSGGDNKGYVTDGNDEMRAEVHLQRPIKATPHAFL